MLGKKNAVAHASKPKAAVDANTPAAPNSTDGETDYASAGAAPSDDALHLAQALRDLEDERQKSQHLAHIVKNSSEKIDFVEKLQDQLEAALEKAQAQNISLVDKISYLESRAAAEAASSRMELDLLRQAVAERDEINASRLAADADFQARLDAVQSELRSRDARIEELAGNLSVRDERIEMLVAQLTEKQTEVERSFIHTAQTQASHESELRARDERIEILLAERDKYASETESLSQNNAINEQECRRLLAEKAELEQQFAAERLEQQKEHALALELAADTAAQSWREKASAAEERMRDSDGQARIAEAKAQTLQRILGQAQAQILAEKSEKHALETHLSRTLQRFAQIEDENIEARRELEQRAAMLQNAELSLAQALNRLSDLEKSLESHRAASAELAAAADAARLALESQLQEAETESAKALEELTSVHLQLEKLGQNNKDLKCALARQGSYAAALVQNRSTIVEPFSISTRVDKQALLQNEMPTPNNPTVRQSRKTKFSLLQRFKLGRWRANPLFDAEYYYRVNPDVAQSGKDAYTHYLRFGIKEKRNPSPYFDVAWYLSRYPDVAAAGVDPLFHYYRYGAWEMRDPSPKFSTIDYLTSNPHLRIRKKNPLLDFIERERSN